MTVTTAIMLDVWLIAATLYAVGRRHIVASRADFWQRRYHDWEPQWCRVQAYIEFGGGAFFMLIIGIGLVIQSCTEFLA